MRHPCVRPSTKLSLSVLTSSILAIGLACGSSDDEPNEPPPASNGAAGSSSPPSSSNGPSTNDPASPAGPTPEEIAALTEMFGMAADQIQSACGTTFDTCGATPGCNEILTCAARNACSGADCYCLGADCSMDGPCRTVIESAPGARTPDATSQSLGPASDAARAVGVCLQGLGGGGGASPPVPTPSQPPAGDAGTGDADAG